MKIGMLWFNNSNKPLEERVREAALFYRNKFGAVPDMCFVNPSEMIQGGSSNGIEIRSSKSILKYHLWIGKSELGENSKEVL